MGLTEDGMWGHRSGKGVWVLWGGYKPHGSGGILAPPNNHILVKNSHTIYFFL